MPSTFWLSTGARLHLGQLDLNGSLGRMYGGIGLALDQPKLELEAWRSAGIEIEAPDAERKRIEKITLLYLQHYSLPGIAIRVTKTLPAHSGLGSGTQLALALGFAISRVYGLDVPLQELAGVTDRESSRSGLGVATFQQGGFVVDGGKPLNAGCGTGESLYYIPPLVARLAFPQDWRIMLVLPCSPERVSGSMEENKFKALSPMDEEISGRIARLVLMQLLPALAEQNLPAFGHAVTGIQEYLGDYFTPVQGGRFATDEGAWMAKYLLSRDVAGVGQSSWGPTVYAFVHKTEAAALSEAVKQLVDDRTRIWLASGINHGASWGWRG
ncbi:beta-ribofuranosylaminobenzene 5'-phosphate synthase family protein [Sporomusa sphaeroides]|uniref:beta-ribofuranosylaminobenzene 5'-phosphate synthase family protein n=1 Tax=Sporomusa sphaeroides TaxID=47679 RepID=UPI00202DB9A8|nr:beta-ribofuranosylaminobenzene 5'-phosphate synthase family protein [Sporomusa sphaeroides]MCM0759188.1 hypothetical protein [Sporomusa sphaeroides DSM 2875]HML35270.1 hypothetical protein [Sporomusa sphaeroides]